MERSLMQRDALIAKLIADMDIGALVGVIVEEEIHDAMTAFSDSALELIGSAAASNKLKGNLRRKFMHAAITNGCESRTRELMFCVQLFNNDLGSNEAFVFIAGLHHLNHFRHTPRLEELAGENLLVATAFLNITAAIWEHTDMENYLAVYESDDEYAEYIKDPELQDIISQKPEAADTIIAYIRERSAADTDGIRGYLSNAMAIREGTL